MKCEKGRMDFRMSIVCSWPEEITREKKKDGDEQDERRRSGKNRLDCQITFE